jgi:hypothetical protein
MLLVMLAGMGGLAAACRDPLVHSRKAAKQQQHYSKGCQHYIREQQQQQQLSPLPRHLVQAEHPLVAFTVPRLFCLGGQTLQQLGCSVCLLLQQLVSDWVLATLQSQIPAWKGC